MPATIVLPAPLTACGLLFGPRDAAVDRLAHALADQSLVPRFGAALGRLSAGARQLLAQRLADVAADLADIDLGHVVLQGWRKHGALHAAGRRTLDDPGSEELVDLATHRITSVHRPQLDVLVDDVPVGSLQFEVRLEFVVHALVGVVRRARLTALQTGRFTLRARLSCYGVVLASREDELDLAAMVDLGAGVPLMPAGVGSRRRGVSTRDA